MLTILVRSRYWLKRSCLATALLLFAYQSASFAMQPILKIGEVQRLPPLQTRSQLPIQPSEMLYLGMWQERFFQYARSNNWLTLGSQQRDGIRWDLLPGGEAVYTVQNDLIYARGFSVHAYFQNSRLVGLRMSRNPSEPGFNLDKLHTLIRAWFPDNRILLRYQVLPQDTTQQVIHAYLGEIPTPFITDLAQLSVPFCQSFLVPNNPINLSLPSPAEHCQPLQQSASSEG